METKRRELVRHINLTAARNLSPLFDEAVREDRPVVITRGRNEYALLMSRNQARRLLQAYTFHVDVLPENEDGGFTLWVRELDIGEWGTSLPETRDRLLETVRDYVRNYMERWDFYRHLPERAVQEPWVRRLSLTESDADLIDVLFEPVEAPEPAHAMA